MTRKVDPVHFFDARGHSMLSHDFIETKMRTLEAEVEKLKRLLAAQVKKNQTATQDQATPTTH